MSQNNGYHMVVESPQSTVLAEYTPVYTTETQHQSEAELEKVFITTLQAQGYDYVHITKEADLIDNLRRQLERLNNIEFSEKEWQGFFHHELANPHWSIEEKTATIQEDSIKILRRDDGSIKNIRLLEKKTIHDNHVQVINQYASNAGTRGNRYDVTVLVNGLPLVHVELKKRGVALQEAFNQIKRYQRESFWAGSGLFEYVQLFVISNGTHTKYYSNTVREQHVRNVSNNKVRRGKSSSHSFEFTSWWTDKKNKLITELLDFTKTFFAKHSLLRVITRYCVFTAERQLLVMRPYQIVASEEIMRRIEIAHNYKKYGSTEAGGYVWHTTGSGKTLTSFKTALLASALPYVEKVLFVVDRKDLDYQTMKEYDRFEKGAANSNTSTAVLKRQLEDSSARIIVTTIQKLARFIARNKGHCVFNQQMVLIFDECHRSQFGDMHGAITKSFKNYYMFGFTGTPIFAGNASLSKTGVFKTTEQTFGSRLHTYTIINAIADKNVLPFKVDYFATMREAESIEDKKVPDIDREKALCAPQRLSNIVSYIRAHFDQKTKRNATYQLKERRVRGFNSIFAVASIDLAKKYYAEFKKQLAGLASDQQLKVALIYSFGTSGEHGLADENSEDTSGLDAGSRRFLDDAIKDYNAMFGTSYDTSSDKFQNYYKDVSCKVKDREVDILIVVNMFLTGFDATTLNTLWVDKNLRFHGLLQAYSRTNRILNSVKSFGNIVCFRNLEEATNRAIALFGDKGASGIVLLKAYRDYYHGYRDGEKQVPGYVQMVHKLMQQFPIDSTQRIDSEQKQKEFIKLYGAILKLRNILTSFDEFAGNELLSARQMQDYHSLYIDLYKEFRDNNERVEKENINDDIVFEMELIKQVEINIDYILELIKKYHEHHAKDEELLIEIKKSIDASVELRNKRDLIHAFIVSLKASSVVDDEWRNFVESKQEEALERIIEEEALDSEKTHEFMRNAFCDGALKTSGVDFAGILPAISRFSVNNERGKKREVVEAKLGEFFERFYGL